jgi:hypothetical protein
MVELRNYLKNILKDDALAQSQDCRPAGRPGYHTGL